MNIKRRLRKQNRVVMKDENPNYYEDTISLFDYGFSNFQRVNISQTETKYNIDNVGAFYSGNDIFGNSKPILQLNQNDSITLPNTITFRDAVSAIPRCLVRCGPIRTVFIIC